MCLLVRPDLMNVCPVVGHKSQLTFRSRKEDIAQDFLELHGTTARGLLYNTHGSDYNQKLLLVGYNGVDMVKFIKCGRLSWTGQLARLQESEIPSI